MENPMIVAIPRTYNIGRGEETDRLYRAESAAAGAIVAVGRELYEFLGSKGIHIDDSDTFALLAVLNGFSRAASVAASVAFLRDHGFQISREGSVSVRGGQIRFVVDDSTVSWQFEKNGKNE